MLASRVRAEEIAVRVGPNRRWLKDVKPDTGLNALRTGAAYLAGSIVARRHEIRGFGMALSFLVGLPTLCETHNDMNLAFAVQHASSRRPALEERAGAPFRQQRFLSALSWLSFIAVLSRRSPSRGGS